MRRTPRYLVCTHLLQPGGWMSPGALELNEAGFIVHASSVMPHPSEDILRLDGFVLPGMPNVQSRAAWRALAGLGRTQAEGEAFLATLSPAELEVIAGQLYVELVEAGFTSVGERLPTGASVEVEAALRAAATQAGLGLTLLTEDLDPERWAAREPDDRLRFGWVGRPGPELETQLQTLRSLDEGAALHLELDGQAAPALPLEPNRCLLGSPGPEDPGAIQAVTPSEAALYGPIAPPPAGRRGISTGRHLSVDLPAELRALACLGRSGDAPAQLPDYSALARDGAFALAQPAGVLAPGFRADLIVLDRRHPRLTGLPPERVLEAFTLGCIGEAVDQVLIGGRRLVEQRHHTARRAAAARYQDTLTRLLRRLP